MQSLIYRIFVFHYATDTVYIRYPILNWFVKEVDSCNQNIIMLPLLIINPFQGRDLRSSDFTLCQVLHAL